MLTALHEVFQPSALGPRNDHDGRNDHPRTINPACDRFQEARRRLHDAVIADDLVQEAAR